MMQVRLIVEPLSTCISGAPIIMALGAASAWGEGREHKESQCVKRKVRYISFFPCLLIICLAMSLSSIHLFIHFFPSAISYFLFIYSIICLLFIHFFCLLLAFIYFHFFFCYSFIRFRFSNKNVEGIRRKSLC